MTTENLAVDIKGLSKAFENKPAVCEVDLQIKPGEIFGFLGPNGSGKTTTMRMICGLLSPDAGSGHCLGYDIIKESTKIKQNIGYMTQNFSLYDDLSVYENLEFIAAIYQVEDPKTNIDACLQRLNFRPDQYRKLAGKLSGGWKQRLALTAAILHQPKLLLLDEPTSGIDPQARREFWDEIHNLSDQGITTLVTTHYMEEAEQCHRLTCISHGHIITTGTTREILRQTKLSMWIVTGEHLKSLSNKLQKLSAVNQIAIVGNELRIIGENAERLAEAVKPFQTDHYDWQLMPATLEDVFIYLTSERKENTI